jgi:hypothetical protein
MRLTYFKRYRMELQLNGFQITPPEPPAGYEFLAWQPSLLEAHVRAKFLSFRDEIDAQVFPCFTELAGCRRLMREIAGKDGFLADATWLAVYRGPDGRHYEPCGTIQGLRDRHGAGSVQNVGVTPRHRNRHLGTSLLFRALAGFQGAGLSRVRLEVTANNDGAVRLYRRLGFVTVKTVFKASEMAYS